jgi:hypothetical protein
LAFFGLFGLLPVLLGSFLFGISSKREFLPAVFLDASEPHASVTAI